MKAPVLKKASVTNEAAASNEAAAPKKARWTIFCAIIDNYGDIGVCWRLARQLVHEYQLAVDLWVDDWSALSEFMAAQLPESHNTHEFIELQHYTAAGVCLQHWQSPWQSLPGRRTSAMRSCRLASGSSFASRGCPGRRGRSAPRRSPGRRRRRPNACRWTGWRAPASPRTATST